MLHRSTAVEIGLTSVLLVGFFHWIVYTDVRQFARQKRKTVMQPSEEEESAKIPSTQTAGGRFCLTDSPQPKVPFVANVMHKGKMRVPTDQSMQAVQEAIANAGCSKEKNRWKEERMGEHAVSRTYRKNTKSGNTQVQMQTEDTNGINAASSLLWKQLQELEIADFDTLLCLLAQATNTSPDNTGLYTISSDRILEYRGLAEKRNSDGYNSGYTNEQHQSVAQSIRRLQKLLLIAEYDAYVPVTRSKKKTMTHKRLRAEGYMVLIDSVLSEHEVRNSTGEVISRIERAWKYRPGSCLDAFTQPPFRYVGVLLQSCLNYNLQKQPIEKRLSIYLMIAFRIQQHRGKIVKRNIGDLYNDLSIGYDARHPQQARERFEEAIKQLCMDGHIGSYSYAVGNPEVLYSFQDAPQLQSHGWFKDWQAWDMKFFPPAIEMSLNEASEQ